LDFLLHLSILLHWSILAAGTHCSFFVYGIQTQLGMGSWQSGSHDSCDAFASHPFISPLALGKAVTTVLDRSGLDAIRCTLGVATDHRRHPSKIPRTMASYYLCGQMPGTTTNDRRPHLGPSVREPETAVKADVANSTAPALFH
jgi:hypothetical protein